MTELCDGSGYQKAIAPYLLYGLSPPRLPQSEEEWRRQMAPWIPCIVKALDDASLCKRQAAVRLLIATRSSSTIEPLLGLLKRVLPDAPEAVQVRRALSVHFRTREVVPFLLAAANDPSLECGDALAGFSGGVQDRRLLDVCLDRFERWRANPANGRCWCNIQQQAAADPTDPRLRDYVRYRLRLESGQNDMPNLIRTICSEHDCGWLRREMVASVKEQCRHSDLWMIQFLAKHAPPGQAKRFLRDLFQASVEEPCRRRVGGLFLKASCGSAAASGDLGAAVRCLEGLDPDVRAGAYWQDSVAIAERVCNYSYGHNGDPGCWNRLRALFGGNVSTGMALDVYEALARLDQGEGQLDRVGALLKDLEPSFFRSLRVAALCGEAISKYQHARWKQLGERAGTAVTMMKPTRLGNPGSFGVTIRGPECAVSRLAATPIVGFVWFRQVGGKLEGRSANLTLEVSGEGWARYKLSVDPFPERKMPAGSLDRVQLMFLGAPNLAPRVTISWKTRG